MPRGAKPGMCMVVLPSPCDRGRAHSAPIARPRVHASHVLMMPQKHASTSLLAASVQGRIYEHLARIWHAPEVRQQ